VARRPVGPLRPGVLLAPAQDDAVTANKIDAVQMSTDTLGVRTHLHTPANSLFRVHASSDIDSGCLRSGACQLQGTGTHWNRGSSRP